MLHCRDKLRFVGTRSAIYPIRTQHYRQCQVAPCHATPRRYRWGSTALPSLALFARLRIGRQRHAPAALPPGKNPWTHFIGGWMSVRADVNGAEKREFLPPPGLESCTVQPTASWYTDWTVQLMSIPSHDSARTPSSYGTHEMQNVWHSMGGLQFIPNFVKIVQFMLTFVSSWNRLAMSRVFTKQSVTDNIRQHLQLSETYCSWVMKTRSAFNPLNAELNPICHLLALLGGATIVVVSRLRVKNWSRFHYSRTVGFR